MPGSANAKSFRVLSSVNAYFIKVDLPEPGLPWIQKTLGVPACCRPLSQSGNPTSGLKSHLNVPSHGLRTWSTLRRRSPFSRHSRKTFVGPVRNMALLTLRLGAYRVARHLGALSSQPSVFQYPHGCNKRKARELQEGWITHSH